MVAPPVSAQRQRRGKDTAAEIEAVSRDRNGDLDVWSIIVRKESQPDPHT